jgi:hypothetical protein
MIRKSLVNRLNNLLEFHEDYVFRGSKNPVEVPEIERKYNGSKITMNRLLGRVEVTLILMQNMKTPYEIGATNICERDEYFLIQCSNDDGLSKTISILTDYIMDSELVVNNNVIKVKKYIFD